MSAKKKSKRSKKSGRKTESNGYVLRTDSLAHRPKLGPKGSKITVEGGVIFGDLHTSQLDNLGCFEGCALIGNTFYMEPESIDEAKQFLIGEVEMRREAEKDRDREKARSSAYIRVIEEFGRVLLRQDREDDQ